MLTNFSKPKSFDKEETISLEGKKVKCLIYGAAILFTAAMTAIGWLFVSPANLFETSGFGTLILRFLLIIICIAASLAAHEYIHYATIVKLTGKKPSIGKYGIYIYLEDEYFTAKGYLMFSLAPIVIIGLILTILLIIASEKLFWLVYIMQIANLAGGTGDYYTAYKILKRKEEKYIRDNGLSVTVYYK